MISNLINLSNQLHYKNKHLKIFIYKDFLYIKNKRQLKIDYNKPNSKEEVYLN